MVFGRRHHDKALLVTHSTFLHWQEHTPAMFQTVRQYIVAFDKYPVENFHSVLRARTKEHDAADKISFKAKEIDECKHEMESFKSTFVPSRKFNFNSEKIDMLKSKAAEFLTTKFESLNHNPNMATLQPEFHNSQSIQLSGNCLICLEIWLQLTKYFHLDTHQLDKHQIQPGK